MNRHPDFYKDFMSAFGIALVFACICLFLLIGCDSGWSVAGWEVK